jgi:hypothetical protein
MKHLKKYNEMLSYSGGDVTKMPIIGKVITKPIGSFESGEYDIVEIIETEKGPIYVANMWYKEWKRIPQLIHSELVQDWLPLSNEELDLKKGLKAVGTAAVAGLVGYGAYDYVKNFGEAVPTDTEVVSNQKFKSYRLSKSETFEISICENDGYIFSKHSYETGSGKNRRTVFVSTVNVTKGSTDIYYASPFFGPTKVSSTKFAGAHHISIKDLNLKESNENYLIYYGGVWTPFDYVVVDLGGYESQGTEFIFQDAKVTSSWKYYEIDSHVYLFKPYKMGGGSFGGGGTGGEY